MRRPFSILLLLLLAVSLHAQNLVELRQKAAAGDSAAMLRLSEKFRFGSEVEANDDSSQFWVKKSAEAGHPEGMYLLGLQGVRRIFDAARYKKGIEWMEKSAAAGFEDARVKLMGIYADKGDGPGEPTQTIKFYDLKKAYGFGLAAAGQGNVAAALFCGNALLNGSGVARNDSAGLAWFQWAAEQKKSPQAQYELGLLWLEGKHTVRKDLFLAKRWLEAAWFNKKGGLDLKTRVDIALHEVDQAFKKTHNLMMQSSLLMPPGAFRYQLRE
ncbi:MAG: sel1 repeat family protein [Bacteroidia bacterium]|nr:sel1 repeat family protein [Bacteroidia bacterium]